ncbi:MAG TPA: dihydrolipoamide acetyltransferase family protein, partial [Solirubrobacterales bacterium]|nr:dihydrolipoamide acetyltransferase family protein [Solirubrobacterales bacterium]
MAEIVMPRLSDSMEEGTVLKWMKRVGDEVAVGDELVEIETDKANMAYESDVAGVLTEVLAEEGDTLPIGAPIAVVGDDKGSTSSTAGPVTAGDPPPPPVAKASSGAVPPTVPPAVRADRVKASPLARRVAKDSGVDLSNIKGSGPGGRIVKKDVERAEVPSSSTPPNAITGVDEEGTGAAAQETAKGTTTYQELTRLQQVVSRRMSESKATAPHFYLQAEIDMSAAVEARSRLKKLTPEGEVVPSFNDMIVKACALALREFPLANGAYRDGRFELYSRVNV